MKPTKIQLSEVSYTKMMLHATLNSRSPIHGILIGEVSGEETDSTAHITDILPVCHSHPTKPIIDMALRFANAYCKDSEDKLDIVGWYTANERVGDTNPSPVAWKVLQGIQKNKTNDEDDTSPRDSLILMMIQSDSYETMLKKECTVDGSGKGFEVFKTHDKKYEDLADVTLSSSATWKEVASNVSDICLKAGEDGGAKLYDFEQHLDGGAEGLKERDWLRNAQVAKLI
eukprot:CAMPEP_0194072768 /NCGR_PEP_ID=MMETSP0149-20130528/417_1 /TAXON_ID=122233 /ORGANISM="Chaetoceros debilis, Strain MM31A-1" /LENGTH=228 /DNA_ID=CAMNT_0038752673 /DNA_START=71 /DNA_END=757 /DNA_ORIENTATION=+